MPISSRRAHSPYPSSPILKLLFMHQNASPCIILTKRDFPLTHLTIPRHSHARRRIYEQSVVKRANVFMKRAVPSIYPASSHGTCHLINSGPAAIQIDEVLVGLMRQARGPVPLQPVRPLDLGLSPPHVNARRRRRCRHRASALFLVSRLCLF